MIEIEKIDDVLYKSAYGIPRIGNYQEIWGQIKNNPEILREATKIKRDKFDERDIVAGLTICDSMLVDYMSVDAVAYKNLINIIYSNLDIARLVVNGASNGGYSFLLMSLWNHKLVLTDEQKAFAVSEAMNKIGTTKYLKAVTAFSQGLTEKGITNDSTTVIELDGAIHPIGVKTKMEYLNYMAIGLSGSQAHGVGEYDIRYCILNNPNWTLQEKQQLIREFWYSDEVYDDCLDTWEWGIVNEAANYEIIPLLTKDEIYNYSYATLLDNYGDKETTDRIWEEIQFCQQMHELRPQQWEREHVSKRVKKA